MTRRVFIAYKSSSLSRLKSDTMEDAEMYIYPTQADLDKKMDVFSVNLKVLAADKPKRGFQQVVDFWTASLTKLLRGYSYFRAAGEAAWKQWEGSRDQDALARASELNIRAMQKANLFWEKRAKFWWELAYVCHYEEIMNEVSFEQLEEVKAWLAPQMPPVANKERIYSSLRRKIYRTLIQGRPLSPRRLIRGLPLIKVGVA